MTSQTIAAIIAASVLILVLAERVHRLSVVRPSLLDRPVVFFAAVCGLMLVLRWPMIVFPRGINPDEAQMLAQAMRYRIHPVPWRDVDGTTSGPLNSMLLDVPLWLGAPASWATARMVLWAANCLTLIFLYLALRRFGTGPDAQFALIPAILFYAFALDPDFAHYSSEALPVLLLSAGIYLLARQWNTEQPSRVQFFLIGLICGSLPFTKLQATPLGVFLAGVAFIRIFAGRYRATPVARTRWLETTLLCLGMAAMTALIVGWVWAKGAISNFWISYILASGAYTQEISLDDRLNNIFTLFTHETAFRPYLLSVMLTAVIILGALHLCRMKLGGRLYQPLMIAVFGTVFSGLCLFIAGKAFLHYLLLLMPALATFQGLVFLRGRKLLEPGSAVRPVRWALAAAALAFLPQSLEPLWYICDVNANYPRKSSAQDDAVTKLIREAAGPGDTMSVWGWMPLYYVETGIAPATRDAIGHYVVSDGPYRQYFRKRYLADLEHSRPAIFVDAVSDGAFMWLNWNSSNTHEGFPELAAFIDDNYALWWSVHLIDGSVPVRIYLLKSRMAVLHLDAGNVETVKAPSFSSPAP